MTDYSKLSAEELRENLLSDKLLHEFMGEEDYTALLDSEAEYDEPSEKVINFCYAGLSKLPAYSDIHERNFSIDELFKAIDTCVPRKHRRLRKTLIIAAAVIGSLLVTQIVTSALGFDLFGYIFNWNKPEVVEIKNNGVINISTGENERIEYTDVEEIPNEMKNLVPEYLFNNFKFYKALLTQRDGNTGSHFSFFDENENFINIGRVNFRNDINVHIEKDDNGYFEEYMISDISYTIFTNTSDYRAVWVIEGYVYSLSTHFKELQEIKDLLDNLY